MSINYCTIASQPIDGFCGSQRAKVLTRLIEKAHGGVVTPPAPQPGIGGHGGTGGIQFTPAPRPPVYSPPIRRDLDQPPVQYEQPLVTVTVEFEGVRGSQTLDMVSRLDFVLITDFEIGDDDTVTVNIGEMEIR